MAVVVHTEYGRWVANRDANAQRHPADPERVDGWRCRWLDDIHRELELTCSCHRIWVVDPDWLIDCGPGGVIIGPALHGIRSPL
jgi:hypothetical protein